MLISKFGGLFGRGLWSEHFLFNGRVRKTHLKQQMVFWRGVLEWNKQHKGYANFFYPIWRFTSHCGGGGGGELCEWQAHFRRETSYSNARGSTRSHHILNMYLCSLSVRYITTLIRQKYVLLVNIRERYSIKISDWIVSCRKLLDNQNWA